ncbi:MAG: nucleotide sugar dehydrogenase [Verrucomicrobiota bacterium]|nr:nucleotide sugar dehydrogenase [Verrucomicrobiota bacterium]
MAYEQVAIVGLGYVGLPLLLRFSEKGIKVLGLDIDSKKVDSLKAGQSYIKHISAAQIAACFADDSRADASTDFSRISGCDAVIICVPTPLTANREPDMSYVFGTGGQIAPHLKKGMLVVLESTTYPGTTDTDLREILEKNSGLRAGEDFHLAFSPEREDPGNKDFKTSQIPKIVGGLTPVCRDKACELYSLAIDLIVPVASCRVAEAIKLTENIFRSVNIAMVNELKIVYEKMGIDIWEVIEGAKTKPFGFMPFYPGPGLGGHCIPIDPFYLTWKAREYGMPTRFIELAGEVNTAMPAYVIQRTLLALNSVEKSIKGAKILIIGLAYKPDVDDDRESPSYELMAKLEELGAAVAYHDPHIPVIRPSRHYARFAGRESVPVTSAEIQGYDLVLISTKHKDVDYPLISEAARLVVDTRNALNQSPKVWKA